jgi:hypothetical protein
MSVNLLSSIENSRHARRPAILCFALMEEFNMRERLYWIALGGVCFWLPFGVSLMLERQLHSVLSAKLHDLSTSRLITLSVE